jgi:hypothetical protein
MPEINFLILSDDEILSPAQLAERLHVTVTWVREQTRARARVRNSDPLPFTKAGKYLAFSWREVCAWLTRHEEGGTTQCVNKKDNPKESRRVVWRLVSGRAYSQRS